MPFSAVAAASVGSTAAVVAISDLVVVASAADLIILHREDNESWTAEQRGNIAKFKTFYNYLLIADAGVNLWSSYRKAASLADDATKFADDVVKGGGQVGKVITRSLNTTDDIRIIDRIKVLRQKLTSDYKRSGNFGWAEVEITELSKSEFYAHSAIDELTGTLPQRVPDISLKPKSEIFEWSTVPNSAGISIPRNIDTEYKILTEIAEKLGSSTNTTGKIRLFTERPPCSSCSKVIEAFSKKYPKIDIEIIHNNGIMLTDF